jgi:hypothetical protein
VCLQETQPEKEEEEHTKEEELRLYFFLFYGRPSILPSFEWH